MSSPQPMTVRRGGAKRGDHGSYVAPVAPVAAPAAEPAGPTEPARAAPAVSAVSAVSAPTVPIGTDTSTPPSAHRGTTQSTQSEATARAKAAYDARPKVTFRGVDEDTATKLRAIYKHQLHQPGGVEGWSEWGRSVLQGFVDDYEQAHGQMAGGEDVRLRAGRIAGN